MNEKLSNLFASVVSTIQGSAIAIGKQINKLPLRVYRVKVENPQKEVKVTGIVEVDQKVTHNKIGGISLAIRELKNALKPLKEIKIANFKDFPEFPKFPEFPREIKVSNPQEKVEVSNFGPLTRSLMAINNAIKALKLDPKITVEPPVVNVPAPVVNVPKGPAPVVNVGAPDLSDIKKIIDYLNEIGPKKPVAVRLSDGKVFYKALERMADIYAGGSNNSGFQDTSGNMGQAQLDRNNNVKVTTSETWDMNDTDESSAPTTYVGEESVDAQWRVRKIVENGPETNVTYATARNNSDVEGYTEAWGDRENLNYGRAGEAL